MQTLRVLIVGAHMDAGRTGTVEVQDGRFVTVAPDGIGRVDRIRVTFANGEWCWTVRNDVRIVS